MTQEDAEKAEREPFHLLALELMGPSYLFWDTDAVMVEKNGKEKHLHWSFRYLNTSNFQKQLKVFCIWETYFKNICIAWVIFSFEEQTPLKNENRPETAFASQPGLFEWKECCFFRNVVSMLQSLMNTTWASIEELLCGKLTTSNLSMI